MHLAHRVGKRSAARHYQQAARCGSRADHFQRRIEELDIGEHAPANLHDGIDLSRRFSLDQRANYTYTAAQMRERGRASMNLFARSRVITVVLCLLPIALLQAQRSAQNAAAAGGFITGVVQGAQGPEAGVWVIAETKDLSTNYIKIVVTDDRGRFMLPDLPNANYKVWVRGYGLVDSMPIETKPKTTALTLRATAAKTPQEAAKIYPGNYWLSLLDPPAKNEFPGTGAQGNGL